ncbi:MAG: CoA transferase [Alphaproteobacteria bacterium]|nr:CoA transferase [Alphaproteobacteria bacterium]
MTQGVLHGITILDLSMFIAGPFGTMLLADLGAEVIKIEPPGGDPVRSNQIGAQVRGENAQFHSYNRNKKSLVLDLKSDAGLAVFDELVKSADVVFDNFRPGVLERLKIDHARLAKINPAIVSCSVSAFGQDGPWAKRAGYDLTVQALGGGMSLTGHDSSGPAHIPFHLGDTAGGLFGALGLLAALAERHRTGKGRRVDVAMFDTQIALLGDEITNYFATGVPSPPHGAGHPNFFPYQAFATADEAIVIAAVGVEKYWVAFCSAIGRPELAADARFSSNASRVAHRDVLEPLVADTLSGKTRAEWLDIFADADVPAAPIQSVAEAAASPQTVARGMVPKIDLDGTTIAVAGNPIKVGDDETVYAAAPVLGADGPAILRARLGYDDAKIAALRADGVVG